MTYCTRCGAPAVGYGFFCASCGAEIVAPKPGGRPADDKLSTTRTEGSHIPQIEPATVPLSLNSFSRLWVGGQLRRLVVAGIATYAVTVVLSAVLAAVLVFVTASLFNLLIGGGTASSTGPAQTATGGTDIGASLHLFAAFTAYIFFASHFGPLEASALGGATFSVLGIGSLSISLAAILLPFLLARRTERHVQLSTAGRAFVRGMVIGIPYGVGALALFLVSFVSVGDQQFGLSIHPSLVGVFLAAIIVGCGGGLGAASIRVVQNAVASSVVRAAARACAAIVIGALMTSAIALAWIALSAWTHAPGATGTGAATPANSAVQQLGWALAGLIPFYCLNAIALTWLAALDGSLFSSSPLHLLMYIGPTVGVVLGALRLRRPADRIEQGCYAAFIAIGTGLLALGVTPAIVNGAALLPNAWLGVLVAFAVGAVSALVAPYLLAIGPVRAFVSGAPTWVMRPVLGLSPGSAATASVDLPIRPSSPAVLREPVRLHVGRTYVAIAVVVALLVLSSGSLVANAQLSLRFSPETAALTYLTAQGRGDADAMWPQMTIDNQGTSMSSTPFVTKDALRAMLTISDNRDITDLSVASSHRQDDANYTVTVRMNRSGQLITSELHLRKEPGRANFILYPVWQVVVVPSIVKVVTYPQAGALSLDGIDTKIVGGNVAIAVIPGVHRLGIAGTEIFAADSRQIDASSDADVTFEVALSSAASGAARKAIDTFLEQCAQRAQLSQLGCPNSVAALGDHQSGIHWTIVGDPTAGMHINSGEAVNSVVAAGVWQMHVSFDYWLNSGNARVKRWDQDVTGDFSDVLRWNGVGFDVTDSGGHSSAATNGVATVPAPSISASLNGSYGWLVAGQYFTPGQRIEAFLYQPSNAPHFVSANAPGLVIRPDGTFVGNFELASHSGPAKIQACDTANVCATVLVTAP